MKPPAWRLDRAVYPHAVQIQTRYRDEDSLRHINNISIAGYYDEARYYLMREVFKEAGRDENVRIVTAESRIAYLGEAFHPDMLDIGSGISRIGRASFEIGQAMFQNGRCVGVCTSTLVQATSEGGLPLDAGFRAILERRLLKAPAEAPPIAGE